MTGISCRKVRHHISDRLEQLAAVVVVTRPECSTMAYITKHFLGRSSSACRRETYIRPLYITTRGGFVDGEWSRRASQVAVFFVVVVLQSSLCWWRRVRRQYPTHSAREKPALTNQNGCCGSTIRPSVKVSLQLLPVGRAAMYRFRPDSSFQSLLPPSRL
jgi:hypothetical protein